MGSGEGNPVRVPRATDMRWCASTARADTRTPRRGGAPPRAASDAAFAACGSGASPSATSRGWLGTAGEPFGVGDRLQDVVLGVYGPPPLIRNAFEVVSDRGDREVVTRPGRGRPIRDRAPDRSFPTAVDRGPVHDPCVCPHLWTRLWIVGQPGSFDRYQDRDGRTAAPIPAIAGSR